MLFNSFDFAIFLPLVFVLYWFVVGKNLKLQNLLLVVASYVFYGWWDYRFLSLIFFSTVVDYAVGVGLGKATAPTKRKLLLATSLIVNLGLLGFFKYYNFFVDSFVSSFAFFGHEFSASTLSIVLPVGISFYTFQTLSYSIDVYRKDLAPAKGFIEFMAYVSFFPQLVAGPIERATNFLPQFYTKREFNYGQSIDGLRQILWGLFKKVVIADNCATYANQIFNNSEDYSGATLALGAFFFAWQIYGDFSGYSDIAIGVSRLFGFHLMRNFAYPYFSRDMAEFWRRWHISLSTWFRDYVYIPLGGSKGGTWMKVRNTFIIFLVSGFWHGANWTFVVWGFLNAVYFLPLLLSNNNRSHIDTVAKGKWLPSLSDLVKMLTTFSLACLAWVFFRARDIGHAMEYLTDLFRGLLNKASYIETLGLFRWEIGITLPLLLGFFIVMEWIGREEHHPLEAFGLKWPRLVRWGFYYAMVVSIFVFAGEEQDFIYFQF